MSLKSWVVVLPIIFMHLNAFAITRVQFDAHLKQIQSLCKFNVRIACHNPLTGKNLRSEKASLHVQFEKLNGIAYEQAQLWGDTIYEGNYASIGDFEVLQIAEIYKEGELIAYRVTYQEPAVDTDTCESSGNYEKDKSCERGFVYESATVSTDFRFVEVLEGDEAKFAPQR
jgi:hypothetical protein